MQQHQIDEELAAPGAEELLASTSTINVAYVGTDGAPRVVPVGFYWTGEDFVISTATTAPKVAALITRPAVALSLDSGNTPGGARALSVRGQAEITIVDGVVAEYLAAARQTMDADAFDQFEAACRQMYDQMARIAVRPQWARYYDFGAGRLPQFLQDLAARNLS